MAPRSEAPRRRRPNRCYGEAMTVVDDELDRREVLRRLPSYGPDWDAAIEYGIDLAQTELNLALMPEQRILQLEALLALQAELRPDGPALDGSNEPPAE
jgi:hypothetical protein